MHGLLEELEPLHFFDGELGRLGVVEDDEGLALRAEVGLGDDVDDVPVLGEDLAEGLLQPFDLDPLLEVLYIDTLRKRSANSYIQVGVQ